MSPYSFALLRLRYAVSHVTLIMSAALYFCVTALSPPHRAREILQRRFASSLSSFRVQGSTTALISAHYSSHVTNVAVARSVSSVR
ncbi:hypothetical protein EDB85DRAFT_1956334 [Lactarius pseudohatsudake]|nr:hypothetical protein EDB85DRAFT_1956334 [Lactarius pseudohatsudake]